MSGPIFKTRRQVLLAGKKSLFILLAGLFFFSCATAPKKRTAEITRIKAEDYPLFSDSLFYDNLSPALEKSIEYLQDRPADSLYSFGPDVYTRDHLVLSMRRLNEFIRTRPDVRELNRFIRKNYNLYSTDDSSEKRILFTGYFEPVIEGSRTKKGPFRYPVLSRPADLVRIRLERFGIRNGPRNLAGRCTGGEVVPYYDRRQIESGTVSLDTAPPIAWIKDRIALFFLQIQGSGKVAFEDGSTINILFDSTNGHPYRSIGKLLIEKGKLKREEVTMPRILAYLKNHPDEIDDILNHNPSYVFFRPSSSGPFGSLGISLTPGRSIAVDPSLFPMPAPAFLKVKVPVIDAESNVVYWTSGDRFVLSQDTGGAIRGRHVDLFFGPGPYAASAAGNMKEFGSIYFLVLKKQTLPKGG